MNKINSLQILRALAASMVVFFHTVDQVSRIIPKNESFFISNLQFFSLGAAGVDLFFCISGFIMIYTHGDDFFKPNASFYFIRRRVLRIVPIYWLLTTLALFIMIVAPQFSYHKRSINWLWIITSYIFIPWYNESGNGFPILGLGWTLNYEMYFYICFSILLFFRKKYFIPIISSFFFISILVGFFANFNHPYLRMITSPMLIEFLLGCLIGLVFKKNIVISNKSGIVILIVSLTIFLNSYLIPNVGVIGLMRIFCWGIPAALLLLTILLTPGIKYDRWPDILRKLGDASYSIYLTQVFSIPLIVKILFFSEKWNSVDINIIIAFVLTLFIGLAFYLIVEKNLIL